MLHIVFWPDGGLPAQGFPCQRGCCVPSHGKRTSHQEYYRCRICRPNSRSSRPADQGGLWIHLAAVSADVGGHGLVLLQVDVLRIKGSGARNQQGHHYHCQRWREPNPSFEFNHALSIYIYIYINTNFFCSWFKFLPLPFFLTESDPQEQCKNHIGEVAFIASSVGAFTVTLFLFIGALIVRCTQVSATVNKWTLLSWSCRRCFRLTGFLSVSTVYKELQTCQSRKNNQT